MGIFIYKNKVLHMTIDQAQQINQDVSTRMHWDDSLSSNIQFIIYTFYFFYFFVYV
jgi:hypothetical protein